MPSVDAANIAYNLLKVGAGTGSRWGRCCLGLAQPVHILDPASPCAASVNMTALATSTPACSASVLMPKFA